MEAAGMLPLAPIASLTTDYRLLITDYRLLITNY